MIGFFTENQNFATMTRNLHTKNMKLSTHDLELVQELYLMQVDLHQLLKGDLSAPEKRAAKQRAREFSKLLNKADWRYMGGEDVLESLRETEREAKDKLGKR